MAESKAVQACGVGFANLLLLLFIALKLTGVIAWSWWWVLAPLWAPLGFAIVVGALAFLFVLIFDPDSERR